MAVRMAEVSTCEVTVKKGERVKKGGQLRIFHFEGSTHGLMFRRGGYVIFDLPEKPWLSANIVHLHKAFAFMANPGNKR